MDKLCKEILTECGIIFEDVTQLNGLIIERDLLLRDDIYEKMKTKISDLKLILSSSFLTSLHKDAYENQKWPLLNLIRQILNTYKINMRPIRKSNGYTSEKKKIFKRYYLLQKK